MQLTVNEPCLSSKSINSLCIFCLIKVIGKFNKKEEVQEEIKKDDTVLLLEEIRDLLKEQVK